MIATGRVGTVGLAEGIIDDTCLVLLHFAVQLGFDMGKKRVIIALQETDRLVFSRGVCWCEVPGQKGLKISESLSLKKRVGQNKQSQF